MGTNYCRSWLPIHLRTSLGWMFVLLLVATSTVTAEPNFPVLSGRVVDDAGILDATTIQDLTEMLEQHERATGEQVVVVTLKSLDGYSIEDFGYQLGRHWGIGQKGKNTGAMLIVVPSEHKVRIEVGYGLEGKLTDAISRTIIEDDIVPNFRRADFNAGVLAGTESILSLLGGGSVTGTEAKTSSAGPPIAISRPGLVQNCPLPMVSDATKPAAIVSARAFRAPGNKITGLMLLISAYTGIGSGRAAASFMRAVPPAKDPVKATALIAGCFTS